MWNTFLGTESSEEATDGHRLRVVAFDRVHRLEMAAAKVWGERVLDRERRAIVGTSVQSDASDWESLNDVGSPSLAWTDAHGEFMLTIPIPNGAAGHPQRRPSHSKSASSLHVNQISLHPNMLPSKKIHQGKSTQG